jgi:2-C-methyl-D-erythritol 2,4-cyclodiphosphate synthase
LLRHMYKVGIGYDIHRLVEGRKLFIGGIEIPYVKGLLGHSDADVLIHAICDALLGAAGEADIGELFPDTDPKYENISSLELLRNVAELINKLEYKISNLDAVIVAEQPPIQPFKKLIRSKLASVLNLGEGQVNLKGKTNEGLGEIGQKQAIACYATAILIKGA